jgi:HD-GYP domain-containing protein (c-di-GMP phosphodiesterase class II)
MTAITLDDTVSTLALMAQAAEARNPLTEGHSERVALAAKGIGRELGLSVTECDRLLIIGRLHNIGIVGTRDSVLLKTGALTPDEYTHIQSHTVLGAKILYPVRQLADVAEVCLNHHERWDGSGYPNSIQGESIPFHARIIAVADVFSALISSRPHRDSLPRPVAADMIAEERGTKHCPRSVDGFLKWFARTGGMIDLPEGV